MGTQGAALPATFSAPELEKAGAEKIISTYVPAKLFKCRLADV